MSEELVELLSWPREGDEHPPELVMREGSRQITGQREQSGGKVENNTRC